MSQLALLVGGAASLGAVFLWARFAGAAFGDALIAGTIWLALAWYFAALALMVSGSRSGRSSRAARWCWTWGMLVYLVHVAAAFHYFHGWSHAHAVEHTRRTSGFGGGVFVSYAFTLLWAADVVWWWLRPSGYADRPRWVTRAVHAFMLFIVFNGAVVFASGPGRWLSLAAMAGLALAWGRQARGQQGST